MSATAKAEACEDLGQREEEGVGIEARRHVHRLTVEEQRTRTTSSSGQIRRQPRQQHGAWSFARDAYVGGAMLEREGAHFARDAYVGGAMLEREGAHFARDAYLGGGKLEREGAHFARDAYLGAAKLEREGGQSRQQESDEETSWRRESWCQPSGWDVDPSSFPTDGNSSTSGWGKLDDGGGDAADYVDLGYRDQELVILGKAEMVRVAYTAKGVDDWIQQCSSAGERHFGIDIEWQPNRLRGDDNPAALFQIAGKRGCLIVQLLYMDRIPDSLKEFCADPRVQLAGVGVKADAKKLLRDHGLKCAGETDIGFLASDVLNRKDLKRAGLATLCTVVLGIPFKKNKNVTISNWAVEGLSLPQITYAAGDACIAYSVLVTLNAIVAERRGSLQELPRYFKG